ncbi:MAG: hypothetical protein GQ523_07060 [Methanophagales archaeon]|nr:hypothetical protein [Methanophagales archaeon]
MVAKNERKLEVLKFVEAEGEEVTAEQVADIFDMEIHNARMPLQRYWKAGLLNRRVVDKKTKKRIYRISENEKNRIKWLEESNHSFSWQMKRRTKNRVM